VSHLKNNVNIYIRQATPILSLGSKNLVIASPPFSQRLMGFQRKAGVEIFKKYGIASSLRSSQ